MRPGFSERTFEFCFNGEFCRTFDGLLASHPHIPSQQLEKDLGYDVEFEIQNENFTASIFFQHKVSHFAEYRAGGNAKFYDAHDGSYFRFGVDSHQHNVLCELSRTRGNAFYCAPKFHRSHELGAHFFANTIGNSVVLLDPMDVGEIHDNEKHNITYCSNGYAVLHSEPRRFEESHSTRERLSTLKRGKISDDYIRELSEELNRRTAESRFATLMPEGLKVRRPIEQVQIILGRIYEVSWILLK